MSRPREHHHRIGHGPQVTIRVDSHALVDDPARVRINRGGRCKANLVTNRPIIPPSGSKIDIELVEQWAELISIKRVADVYGHSLMNASRAIFSPKTVEINNA